VYIFIFVLTCFYAEYLALGVELTRAVLLPLKKKNVQLRALESSSPGVKDTEETCVNNKNIHLQAEKNTHINTNSFTLLRRGGGFCCVCETSRSSSSSRVLRVDSFAVLTKPG